MENDINAKEEKAIIKRQFGVLIIAIIIIIPLTILLRLVYHNTLRYVFLLGTVPLFYIAFSSMKDRVSILRLREEKEYPKGKQAFLRGAIFLVIEIAALIFFLTPLLDKFINF